MKKLLLTISLVLMLSACGGLKPIAFEDTVAYKDYTLENGYILGQKGFYVMYGVFKHRLGTLKAGECYVTQPEPGKYKFSIKEVVDKHPELDSPEVQRAAKEQK